MSRAPFPITAITYSICDTCAPAVVYGDVSGLDPSRADDVLGCIRVAGPLAYVGTTMPVAFWTCEFCGRATIGTLHNFVGQTLP